MTTVLTEPQLLRIPEKFFVDAELQGGGRAVPLL